MVPNDCPLSPPQFECIMLLAQGRLYDQIAERRGCAHSTVRSHLHNAYKRLGVHTGPEAVAEIYRRGWAVPDDDSDIKISHATHLYLEAFDRHLRARTEDGCPEIPPLLILAIAGEPETGSTAVTPPDQRIEMTTMFCALAVEATWRTFPPREDPFMPQLTRTICNHADGYPAPPPGVTRPCRKCGSDLTPSAKMAAAANGQVAAAGTTGLDATYPGNRDASHIAATNRL
jgi:DNA-binding CsgD family transcriptional regulator